MSNIGKNRASYSTNAVPTSSKTKKIRELFNLDEKVDSARQKKSLNEEVFFKNDGLKVRDQISQMISDVINNSSAGIPKENIKFKVNINNNFYNANIDVIINNDKEHSLKASSNNNIASNKEESKREETGGLGSFFSN